MGKRHNVFISYHHDEDKPFSYFDKRDFEYREEFEKMCSDEFDIMESKAVQDGDIPDDSSSDNTHRIIRDKYLRNSTVAVVLIGKETWRRKHVDWEIYSSLRKTEYNSRMGLIGILLPTYEKSNYKYDYENHKYHLDGGSGYCDKNTIPQRLAMNLDNGFAKVYDWSTNPYEIQQWIHEAFKRKDKINPDNSLPMYKKNRTADRWQ